MKKYFVHFLLFLSLYSFQTQATSLYIPDKFKVRSNYTSPAYTFYDGGNKIAWIHKYGETSLSTYKLFDASGHLEATADLNRLTDPIQLRLFDKQYYIGMLEEPSYSHRYRTFYIYDPITHIRLISGHYNYWGTRIKLVNEQTQRQFADMSSGYFCVWCDWHFKIIDRDAFNQLSVNPKTVLFSLGLQAEAWRTYQPDCHCDCDCLTPIQSTLDSKVKNALQQIQSFYQMTPIKQPSEEAINDIITKLDDAFDNKTKGMAFQTNLQKETAYIDFCLSYIQSKEISNKERDLIYYLFSRQLKDDLRHQ